MIQIADFTPFRKDPQVLSLQALVEAVSLGLQNKTITQSEYADLMSDIDRLRAVISLKNNLELNQKIHDSIIALIELARLVKF